MVGLVGLEPTGRKAFKAPAYTDSATNPNMVPTVGLEPTLYKLSTYCVYQLRDAGMKMVATGGFEPHTKLLMREPGPTWPRRKN